MLLISRADGGWMRAAGAVMGLSSVAVMTNSLLLQRQHSVQAVSEEAAPEHQQSATAPVTAAAAGVAS